MQQTDPTFLTPEMHRVLEVLDQPGVSWVTTPGLILETGYTREQLLELLPELYQPGLIHGRPRRESYCSEWAITNAGRMALDGLEQLRFEVA